jgi:hypothetical protein
MTQDRGTQLFPSPKPFCLTVAVTIAFNDSFLHLHYHLRIKENAGGNFHADLDGDDNADNIRDVLLGLSPRPFCVILFHQSSPCLLPSFFNCNIESWGSWKESGEEGRDRPRMISSSWHGLL